MSIDLDTVLCWLLAPAVILAAYMLGRLVMWRLYR